MSRAEQLLGPWGEIKVWLGPSFEDTVFEMSSDRYAANDIPDIITELQAAIEATRKKFER